MNSWQEKAESQVPFRQAGIGWIDRAIGVIDPARALRRVRARMALRAVEGALADESERFSYDGAAAGRRSHGWYAPSSDANVEIMGSLVWLRNRSRELIRNNPYATKAVEELVGNAVGTGIVPQSKTGNTTLDALIDEKWKYFAEQCDVHRGFGYAGTDYYGMQALVMRTTAESGEMVARHRPRLAKDNLKVAYQIQMLEADFLDHARTLGTVNGHIMQGVEFDMIGRRVAYWLYSYHPGGMLVLNPRGGIVSQRIPADQVLHSYRQLRPGQVRGIPWLHPVMMALKDLDDYCDAERLRKKIEACVVAFVTQPEGQLGAPLGTQKSTSPYTSTPIESFEPGMVEYLKTGQDIKFNNPPAAGGYREYKTTELEGIAAGIGMPYELMTGDMSKVNFSSWRGGMLGFRNTIENYRWLMLMPGFCLPTHRRFIDTLILQGDIPTKYLLDPSIHVYATQWTAPRFENVDPVKDAEGVLKDIRMGRITWFEAVAANGFDPTTQLLQIQLFNKLLDKYEIILDCDPRNMTLRGQEQAADTEERTPTGKPSGKNAGPQGMNAMSDEDVNALKELLVSQREQFDRKWNNPVRSYLM
jgi:lambda family phage portal protein